MSAFRIASLGAQNHFGVTRNERLSAQAKLRVLTERFIGLGSKHEAFDEWRGREPLSPSNLVGRVGVLTLIALCLGLAARLLVGGL
jgi:hypothetical protein